MIDEQKRTQKLAEIDKAMKELEDNGEKFKIVIFHDIGSKDYIEKYYKYSIIIEK